MNNSNNITIESVISEAIKRVKERQKTYEEEYKNKPNDKFLDGTIFGMTVVLDMLRNDVSVYREDKLEELGLLK